MGLDGVNFGKDYAAEFQAKQDAYLQKAAENLSKVGVTVSIGQPVVKTPDLDKPIAGAELEHPETPAAETAVVPAAEEKPAVEETPAPVANDSKYKVFAKRTIVDNASFQKKEDEIATNYYQIRNMTDDEIKNFAKKYTANELPEDASKEIIEQTENDIVTAYTHIKSLDNNGIRSLANYYTENQKNKENFDNTVTYYDKAEYKAAEAERKEARKQLVEQFRNEGLSKREAKKKADSMLVHNEYLGKTLFGIHSARKAVENNRELFFDENGNFSNEKYHEFALKQANINNQGAGEEVDYTFSLKERRKADIDEALKDASMTTLGKVVRKSGMETERNNTALYRGLAIAGIVGTGIGVGSAVGGLTSTAAAGSASTSAAGATAGTAAAAGSTAAATSGAVATATISGELIGGATGAALSPLATLFRDNGKKDGHALKIYTYTEKQKPQPQPPVVNPPVVEPVQDPPVQPCPTEEWDEKVCTHTVIPGSSWAYYANKSGITINGKKPAGNMLISYLYAQQLMYGIKNPKGLNETRFLPVGAEYVQHSDFSKLFNDETVMNQYGRYLNPLKNAEINVDNCVELNGKVNGRRNPKYKFGGFVRNNTTVAHYKQSCEDNVPVVTHR